MAAARPARGDRAARSAPAGQSARTGRTRLSTEERREQLLSVGARLFAQSPYDDVWIEQVAEIAGVSRGLLYHYFPNKRDFFAAVVRRESARMLRQTAAVPGVPVDDQLRSGIDTYLRYAEANAHGFRAFHRAQAAGDPGVRAAYEAGVAAQEEQILLALAEDGKPPSATDRLAVRGWLAFMTTVCQQWLESPDETPRDAVRELCARALLGALAR
ncbi:TetR/AcrR family transcriptional regulator [Phaeacidiphilus oryzae]|uniref:TetR/AcrR family transcriptional regulator n=1 Tax=Phaeacidiphilus oryzae TaxID=348818 RepID=UPI00068F21BE|nr:TetR/AcrR family transcriptional regulator [Phaeacidiphilus oryzae]